MHWVSCALNDGEVPPSGLQIMRNFENAAKKAGATVEGQYPGWCKANDDAERMLRMGNSCTSYALTLKFVRGGKELWGFLQAGENDGAYLLTVSEREEMQQDIAVNERAGCAQRRGDGTARRWLASASHVHELDS